eukprot:841623-Pyramimonas_sp.AAC.1
MSRRVGVRVGGAFGFRAILEAPRFTSDGPNFAVAVQPLDNSKAAPTSNPNNCKMPNGEPRKAQRPPAKTKMSLELPRCPQETPPARWAGPK